MTPGRMPVLLAGLALGLLAALAAACGSGSEPTGPRLLLEGDSFDMGEIRVGQVVQRSVQFRNGGDDSLEVTIVKVRPAPDAACGCGVEGNEVRPPAVPPGDAGELVFTLRAPEGMEAMEDKMLAELESNDPANPHPTITLVFNMSP